MEGKRSDRDHVTVITPAYNASPYIAETIASVRRQTFPYFRHLIIDDGSTDRTVEVVEKAAAGDHRIRLESVPRAGQYSSRNRALKQANTEFISFLDADDVWEPTFLEELLRALRSAHPTVGGVFSRSLMIDSAGRPFRRLGTACRAPPGRYDLLRMLENVCPPGNCSCLIVRRRCIEDVGGFDEDLICASDFDLWLRICRDSSGPYFEAIPRPLVRYRQHARNFSSRHRSLQLATFRILFDRYAVGLDRTERGRVALGFAAYAMRAGDRADAAHWLTLARQAAWRDHFRSPQGAVAFLARIFGVSIASLLLDVAKRLYRESHPEPRERAAHGLQHDSS